MVYELVLDDYEIEVFVTAWVMKLLRDFVRAATRRDRERR